MPIAELVIGGKITELVAGAVLGLGVTIIYDIFRKADDTSVINRLSDTISSISPLLDQIDKRSKVEGSPLREVHERLTRLLEFAYVLVEAYKKLGRSRHVRRKYRYIKALKVIELALLGIVAEVQIDQWADIKEMKAKISEIIDQWADIKEMKAKISEMHAR